jgi:hypothetical protein
MHSIHDNLTDLYVEDQEIIVDFTNSKYVDFWQFRRPDNMDLNMSVSYI